MNNSKLPTSFHDLRRPIYLQRNRNEKKILIRFAYRYRLARSLEKTIAPHVGRTLKGYDAIHKVFLIYTAYEQIIKAANRLEKSSSHCYSDNEKREWTRPEAHPALPR